MTYAQAFKKVWELLEKDDCREAEETAREYGIEINYEYADEGKIYIDDECMTFEAE